MNIKKSKRLDGLKLYNTVEKSQESFYSGSKEILKLDWNESTQGIDNNIFEKLLKQLSLSKFNIYPQLGSDELKNKLSNYTNNHKLNIEVFNGSDNALDAICKTFLDLKDEISMISPTYTNFGTISQTYGSKVIDIVMPRPFDTDMDFIINNVKKIKPKICYLANPNNPTGVTYKLDEIEILISENPKVLFVIDEAYYEFSESSCSELINTYNNLFVVRSFSKAFGLAGLRVGYLIGCNNLINKIGLVINKKDVNLVGQFASCLCLDNKLYMTDFVTEVKEQQIRISSFFTEKGFKNNFGDGNFLMVKVSNPQEFIKKCASENLFIRDRSYLPNLSNYVRFTIGDKNSMDRLISILENINLSSYLI